MSRRKKIAPYQMFWAFVVAGFFCIVFIVYLNVRKVMDEDNTGKQSHGAVAIRRKPVPENHVVEDSRNSADMIRNGKYFESPASKRSHPPRKGDILIPQENPYQVQNSGQQESDNQ